jgi:uncharacterized protein (DUF427 family)
MNTTLSVVVFDVNETLSGMAHGRPVQRGRCPGRALHAAAWFYSEPKKRAMPLKDRVAFWRGVRIEA